MISTYIARFETPHFVFEGVGQNELFARLALVRAWNEHADQSEADRGYIVGFWEDIQVLRYVHGRGYRDGAEIVELPPVDEVLDTREFEKGDSVHVLWLWEGRDLRHGMVMGHRDGGPSTGLTDVKMDHDGRVHTVDTRMIL